MFSISIILFLSILFYSCKSSFLWKTQSKIFLWLLFMPLFNWRYLHGLFLWFLTLGKSLIHLNLQYFYRLLQYVVRSLILLYLINQDLCFRKFFLAVKTLMLYMVVKSLVFVVSLEDLLNWILNFVFADFFFLYSGFELLFYIVSVDGSLLVEHLIVELQISKSLFTLFLCDFWKLLLSRDGSMLLCTGSNQRQIGSERSMNMFIVCVLQWGCQGAKLRDIKFLKIIDTTSTYSLKGFEINIYLASFFHQAWLINWAFWSPIGSKLYIR